jgi:hypothetical protein
VCVCFFKVWHVAEGLLSVSRKMPESSSAALFEMGLKLAKIGLVLIAYRVNKIKVD